MNEIYTRQVLPSKGYRELIGTAICVFNSNNSFIIENILRADQAKQSEWHLLIDKVSGQLSRDIKNTITANSDDAIANIFIEIVNIRNRIVHSFQVTVPTGVTDDLDNQILATKYKDGRQEFITEDFLLNFIKKNEELSTKLHKYRGY